VSTAGGQDTEGTAPAVPSQLTTEQIATLPDDLMAEAELDDLAENFEMRALMRLAAQRICDLEEELISARSELHKLKMAVALHRASRDWIGGKERCDRELWEHVADVPWHDVKGDG
jgi:hypothetical protein